MPLNAEQLGQQQKNVGHFKLLAHDTNRRHTLSRLIDTDGVGYSKKTYKYNFNNTFTQRRA